MENYFYRLDEDGNAVIFENDGNQATKLDVLNIYPIDSELSTQYEHANGIVLSVEDAHKIGISNEDNYTIQKQREQLTEKLFNIICENDGDIRAAAIDANENHNINVAYETFTQNCWYNAITRYKK